MEDIPYNQLYKDGDRIVIQLEDNSIFEGDYSGGGTNRIELSNAKEHNNPNELNGIYSFYRNEIKQHQGLKIKLTEKPLETENVSENELCENVSKIKIIEEEYNRLVQMSKDYVYIDKADKRYYEAIKKLSCAETIGVASIGMDPNLNTRIILLVISTWKEVFLFDTIEHKQRYFYPELKELFESEYICKVMHKGGPLVTILYQNYKVYTQNIFDIEVVDLIIEKSKSKICPPTTRNLSECLVQYINLPASLLNGALKPSTKKWFERPLSDKRKLYASQIGTYLILLKDQMLKVLLGRVYKTIEDTHDFYGNLSQYDFAVAAAQNKLSTGFKKLIPLLSGLGGIDNFQSSELTSGEIRDLSSESAAS